MADKDRYLHQGFSELDDLTNLIYEVILQTWFIGYNQIPYQASGAFSQTMMTMCKEVPYAVSGVELISVGNSTGSPGSALIKPRPVCRVRIFANFKGAVASMDGSLFDFGTCGTS